MAAIKIRTWKVKAEGNRSKVLTLPASWVNDINLTYGDRLDIFRDENDRLIIEKAKPAGTCSPNPASEKDFTPDSGERGIEA